MKATIPYEALLIMNFYDPNNITSKVMLTIRKVKTYRNTSRNENA